MGDHPTKKKKRLMGDRKFFRFRFPWQSTASSSRPVTEPRGLRLPSHPPAESPMERLATMAVPIQEGPFGEALEQPPLPPVQAPESASELQSTSRGAAESGVKLLASPAREARAASQPQSPSLAATQSEAATLCASPLSTTTQIQPTTQIASQPPSPSSLATQIDDQTFAEPSSPSRAVNQALGTDKAVSQPSTPSKQIHLTEDHLQPALSVSQGERKLAAPLPSSKSTEREEHSKLSMDEKTVSNVSLASENSEAYMRLGTESEKSDGSVHIHRGYKTNPDQSPKATPDGERSFNFKQDSRAKDSASKTYVNSNTQSFTNSLVLDSSLIERNPGVQLAFSLGSGISIL